MTSVLKMQDIDVVILCGGKGERLQSVVKDRPKPMAKIQDKIFMDILLAYLASFGFRRFILCVCYMSNFIKEYYQNKATPFEVLFSEEKNPLGTAGAIKNAEALIKSNPFLVMNGDSVCKMDYGAFARFYTEKRASYLMALYKVLNTKDYGKVTLDKLGRIVKFQEKLDSGSGNNFISTGVYLLDKNILSKIPKDLKCSIEYEVFPGVVNQGFWGFTGVDEFIDIGTPERLEKAKTTLDKLT